MGAIEEYKEVSERYTFLKEQIDDVERSKSELNKIIEDLDRLHEREVPDPVSEDQHRVCRLLYGLFRPGGKGELILEEPDNCLESAH